MTSSLRRLLLAFSLGTFLIVPSAFARTWFIAADGSGDAPTIQAGVDAASPGDTVLVGPGVYSDSYPVVVDGATHQVNIHLTKNLVLTSRDGALATRLTGTVNNILVLAENLASSAVIRGFDMRVTPAAGLGCVDMARVSPPPGFVFGIRCLNSSCLITENVLHDNHAITLINSPATVADNDIEAAAEGVWCEGSAATISHNRITDCGLAIVIGESAVTVTDNEIGGSSFGDMCAGIIVSNSVGSVFIGHNQFLNIYHEAIQGSAPTLTIEENGMIGCGYAVYCRSANLVVRKNVVASAGGIYIEGSGVITQNTIASAAYGIDVLGGNPLVERNIIVGPGSGVFCSIASPVFHCNDVFTTGERYHGCPNPTGSNGNISTDPLFCGIPGSLNFQLQSVSPCAPGHHPDGVDCGLIGALDVGCGAVNTQSRSWGAIKAMYRSK